MIENAKVEEEIGGGADPGSHAAPRIRVQPGGD